MIFKRVISRFLEFLSFILTLSAEIIYFVMLFMFFIEKAEDLNPVKKGRKLQYSLYPIKIFF